MVQRVCPHTGKERYESRAVARACVSRLRAKTGYRTETYRCAHCAGWHVGRPFLRGRPVMGRPRPEARSDQEAS